MIKGFVFDKDGTLIDFNTIWLPITKNVVMRLCERYEVQHLKESLLKAIGVEGEEVNPSGVLASKTIQDIAAIWYQMIGRKVPFDVFEEDVKVTFLLKAYQNIELVQLISGVKETLYELKRQGFHLGIVTADTKDITELMLKKLGIEELFEFVGTNDGVTPAKPHPRHLQHFCETSGLKNSEVAMVGDTLCDMQFGKNFGAYTIGVLSGTGKDSNLKEHADLIISSVAELLNRKEWAK